MPVDPRERDPRFPNRPAHLDFIILSEAVQENDRLAETPGVQLFDIVGVDEESFAYMMKNRLEKSVPADFFTDRATAAATLSATYADGFALGRRFAEMKSNQKEE